MLLFFGGGGKEVCISAAAENDERPMTRRESLELYGQGHCKQLFQHSSEFREHGFVVPTTVNSALVAQHCSALLVDTLNDLREKGIFVHNVAPVRMLSLVVAHFDQAHFKSLPDPPKDYAVLTMLGTSPYMRPEDGRHTSFVEREGTISSDMRRELNNLKDGITRAIPCYLEIEVVDPSVWVVLPKSDEWKLSHEHEMRREESKDLVVSLTKAANLAPRSRTVLRIPVRNGERHMLKDSNSWVRVKAHGESRVYVPWKHSYSHATTAVLERNKAFYVDSNRRMPSFVEKHLPVLFRMLKHEYEHLELPGINTSDDKAEVVEALRREGVTSTMTLNGYCIALSFSFIVDVLCTGRNSRSHFQRIQQDVGDTDVAFVLYARATMGRIVNESVNRLTSLRLPPPKFWPPSVPFGTWETTVVNLSR